MANSPPNSTMTLKAAMDLFGREMSVSGETEAMQGFLGMLDACALQMTDGALK